MIKVEFTEEDIKALNYECYHHPHPRVQRKMEALWLKSHGLCQNDICHLTGISSNTLRSYLREYNRDNIEALKILNFYQPQSELNQHKQTIESCFREHPPATVKKAMAKIEDLTGI